MGKINGCNRVYSCVVSGRNLLKFGVLKKTNFGISYFIVVVVNSLLVVHELELVRRRLLYKDFKLDFHRFLTNKSDNVGCMLKYMYSWSFH